MNQGLISIYILCITLYFLIFTQDYNTAIIFGTGCFFIFLTGVRVLRKTGGKRNSFHIYTLGFILSSFFIFLNYLHFYDFSTSSLSLGKDALLYHELASDISKTQSLENININFIGYPLLLSVLYFFFSENFILGLLLNLWMFSLSLIYIRKLTILVFYKNFKKENLADYSMLLFLLVPYIVRNSTLLIKDSLIVFSFLLIFVKIIQFKYFHFSKIDFIKIIIGILLIGFLRAPYLFLIPIIFLTIVGVSNFKNIILISISLVITGAIMIISFQYSTHELNTETLTETYVLRDGNAKEEGSSTVYSLIGGDYKNKGITEKLKLLPITTVMQVLLPFPFTASSESETPPVYIYSVKMNFIWYFVFILIVFYFVFLRKKHKNKLLNKIMVLGAIFYLIPAFTEGGITPRYATPFIPIMLVGASYSLFMIRSFSLYSKKLPLLIIPPVLTILLFLLLKG